jgi:alpha-glucosidase
MHLPLRFLRRTFFPLALIAGNFLQAQPAGVLHSPDGRLAVEFKLNADRAPVYLIRQGGQILLPESRLGLIRDDADFSRGLALTSAAPVEPVEDRYELLTAKRRLNDYRANRQVFHLATADGKKMDVIFQVSNDGVAFRYFFPETSTEVHSLKEEISSFHFQPGTKAWLQPMSVAKSGWAKATPAYEEFYEKEIAVGTPSTLGAGWVYPALFKSGDSWLLVSEGSLGRNYCGTRLRSESPDGEYSVGFPDARETMHGLPVNPSSTLPWLTPWRLITIGSLRTIAESTLGTDLAEKPAGPADPSIKPGKASWSWPQLGDRQTNYDVQKHFVDFAADMGWSYCLVDALWDKQIGYEKIKELADYARTKNVGLILWYNSNGDWNEAPQTPKDKLTTHEKRVQEFDRLKAMGIVGLKIDFFGGDGQPVIDYYLDLLADAAPYGFLMNFHGATLPRGWQRTYPHLMTMEAIKGFEYITFEQKNADEEPTHAAMLPFTRNVFDPMDFTPVCLDKIGKTKLRTTAAFELALSVIFTSGVQHYVDVPEGMAKMPAYVKAFMQHVPSVWDETKFIDGYPGKFAVFARRGDGRWYVAGINGEATEKTLTLELAALAGAKGTGVLTTDGQGELFTQQPVALGPEKKLTVTIKPHGGFGIVFD